MLSRTPIFRPSPSTDLGHAFVSFYERFGRAPGVVETQWLDALRARATRTGDVTLVGITDSLKSALDDATGYDKEFAAAFTERYEAALAHAYPLSNALRQQHQWQQDLTRDFTLNHFDGGIVRVMEESDEPGVKAFIREILLKLQVQNAREKVLKQAFEVYSEALVYWLLRERCGHKLKIKKIEETDESSPDFACELLDDTTENHTWLKFYIEVKTFDVGDGRLKEMAEDAMDAQIEIDEQVAGGKRVAMSEREIQPYLKAGGDPKYDPRSPRMVTERVIDRVNRAFKKSQFENGPTFALANMLRLPLFGQGGGALVPAFVPDRETANVESGVLWHVAFGRFGERMYRQAEFEGAENIDGDLQKVGVLLDDPAGRIPTPGLIALHWDHNRYRFDGMSDRTWKRGDWGANESDYVILRLCDDFNNSSNENAYLHSHGKRRPCDDR